MPRQRVGFAVSAWLLVGCALDMTQANELSQERLNSGGWRGYSRDGITSTCQDQLLNGDEEGVDCGGSCTPCPTCTDGVKNGDEEGIDCGIACQLMCRWPRSCLEMLLDQPSLPSGNYSIYPWREASQQGAPVSSWLPDTIRPIPQEVAINVYCDMETDGGGYTIYRVKNGIETSNHSAPNSCHEVGMDIVVPRSKAHWAALLNLTGPEYFSLVPGIYKPSSGGDYSTMAMNSANVPNWVAVDHGSWWLSDVPTGEPTGDYLAECWMGMSEWNLTTTGLAFNDYTFNGTETCDYSAWTYVCSTNDKDFPSHRPPGKPGGRDPATKALPEPNWPLIVTDAASFAAASAALLTRPPPYHITLARDVWAGEHTMVIPTGKTVHFTSHPEACGGDGTSAGGSPGQKNLGVPPAAHTHHSCQYSLFGIAQTAPFYDSFGSYGTGHTDGSLGGLFEIQPNGTLIIEDVILHSSIQERGGALNANHGDVEIVNCEFNSNEAASYGGAIYSLISNVMVENTTFIGNQAISGGAIYNDRGVVKTSNVSFSNNIAKERNGGSLYSLMGHVNLFNSTFFNNTAKNGGAIYNEEAELDMERSVFYENVADSNGGAVHNHFGNIRANDCSMTNNLVYHKGGAVHNHYGHVDMANSNFYCNLARWESYDYGDLPITKYLGRRAVEINDLDRSGNAVYHRYILESNGADDGQAVLAPLNLALNRPTDASSNYYAEAGICSNGGLTTSMADCEETGNTYSPAFCSDPLFTEKYECEGGMDALGEPAGNTWTLSACSDGSTNVEWSECMLTGNRWTDWTSLAVNGDTKSRTPPNIFISSNSPQPSWWGVHLAQPTTNPEVRFHASDCCSPTYHHWKYSPQAGNPSTDQIAARQQGDFGQTFDCCAVDFGRRVDFHIGYHANWRMVNHCGSITSVEDSVSYSTKCVGEGEYLFVTGGSASDGWLLIVEVEVIGVPSNWTSLHKRVQQVTDWVDGVPTVVDEIVSYDDAHFDCNNWFGTQPGVQFTSETVTAHDLSTCSKSLRVDSSTTFVLEYEAGTLVTRNSTSNVTRPGSCKFSNGALSTPQDVVLDAGALSAPVAAELKNRKRIKGREDMVRARLPSHLNAAQPGGGSRRALQVNANDDGGAAFRDEPVSAGKDEVYGWLKKQRMEKLRPRLAQIGVAALDDLKFLQKGSLRGFGLTKLAEKRFWNAVHDLHLHKVHSGDDGQFRQPWRKRVESESEATGLRAAEAGAMAGQFFKDVDAMRDLSAPGMAKMGAPTAEEDGQKYWADIARETIEHHKRDLAAAEAKAEAAEHRLAEAEAKAAALAERRRLAVPSREYEPIDVEDNTMLSCVSWRETLGCDPHGPRSVAGDVACNVVVKSGRSGYCECGGNTRRAHTTCEHRPFTCDAICAGWQSGQLAAAAAAAAEKLSAVGPTGNEASPANATASPPLPPLVDRPPSPDGSPVARLLAALKQRKGGDGGPGAPSA